MYRVGFPGWKIAARFGAHLLIKIDVLYDKEAGVFVATSRDLPGLVVEAPVMNELFAEVYNCLSMLLAEKLKNVPIKRPVAAWDGDFCSA